MKNLREYLEEQMNEDLIQAVLSGSRSDSGPSKVKIRPVKLKNQICYQASATEGTKIFHKNYILIMSIFTYFQTLLTNTHHEYTKYSIANYIFGYI